MKSLFVAIVAVSVITGCGTMKTAGVEKNEVVQVGSGRDPTRCDEIPRIYSGVAYDLCEMNRTANIDAAGIDGKVPTSEAIEFALNVVADTLVLPWTFYRQVTDGNIKVK